MDDRLLSREEAAVLLKVTPKSLASWAYLGRGPSYFRAGRRCIYRESEVIEWLEDQRVTPETGGVMPGVTDRA